MLDNERGPTNKKITHEITTSGRVRCNHHLAGLGTDFNLISELMAPWHDRPVHRHSAMASPRSVTWQHALHSTQGTPYLCPAGKSGRWTSAYLRALCKRVLLCSNRAHGEAIGEGNVETLLGAAVPYCSTEKNGARNARYSHNCRDMGRRVRQCYR